MTEYAICARICNINMNMNIHIIVKWLRIIMATEILTHMDNEISICSWNLKGLAGSKPYMLDLLHMADICVISEHHLYNNQLYKLESISADHDMYAKSCRLLDDANVTDIMGYGGIAIIWHTHLSY